ncbi:MAG: DUF4160 domain-containing protein [Clostridia bacterium]|nr:DUF4160 domain-containing protein [Clostridia bacterium]
MPELARFYGIVVYINYEDIGQHKKPHIHAVFSGREASVGVDGEPLAGELPKKQMRLLQAWIALHEDELYDAWIKAVKKEPVERIEPLCGL